MYKWSVKTRFLVSIALGMLLLLTSFNIVANINKNPSKVVYNYNNDTTTITNELDQLTSYKANLKDENDSVLLYNYTLQVTTDTPIQYSFSYIANFYYNEVTTTSYIGSYQHTEFFWVNQSKTLSIITEFPALQNGSIAIALSRTTTDITNHLSSTYSNYFYFNLTQNHFLGSLRIDPVINLQDYNNDGDLDFAELIVSMSGDNYTYSPIYVSQAGETTNPLININYAFYYYDPNTKQVGNELMSRTTYQRTVNYQYRPFTYYFFPPTQSYYICKVTISLFNMELVKWNYTFYMDHSSWFYEQPHELKTKLIDINSDGNNDSIQFSIIANPENSILSKLDYDMRVNVEYYNTSINEYQPFSYPSSYILTPRYGDPWNQLTYFFTAPISGNYKFNVSLVYDELNYYNFETHIFNYTLGKATPKFNYLLFRVNAQYSSEIPMSFQILDELEGSIQNGETMPTNFSIKYDFYYRDIYSQKLESLVSYLNTYTNESNDYIAVSDFQGYTADECGDYYVNVSLYIDDVLYYWEYIHVPLPSRIIPLEMITKVNEKGIRDVDNDGLSDTVYFILQADLKDNPVPTNLTLVATLFREESQDTYIHEKTFLREYHFEATTKTIDVQFEIGFSGNFSMELQWISNDQRSSYITEFRFSLSDDQIFFNTTTTTNAQDTETNETSVQNTVPTNSLPGNTYLLTISALFLISFIIKIRKIKKIYT